MRTNWHKALLVSFVLIMSSLAGCLGSDEETTEDNSDATVDNGTNNTTFSGPYGNVMVSTYHVGEIVKAIGGDTLNVDYMSLDNIPVHDYEPSASDLVRLSQTDLFFYHGLGLEPWAVSYTHLTLPTNIGV